MKHKFHNVGKALEEIQRLEKLLGLEPSKPTFSISKANERVIELEALAAAKATTAAAIGAVKLAEMVSAETTSFSTPQTPSTMVSKYPLAATAHEFTRMKADDRMNFCQDRGVMLRTEFFQLTDASKSFFCRNGGKIVDSLTDEPVKAAPATASTMTREQFRLLTPAQQMGFCKAGGAILN